MSEQLSLPHPYLETDNPKHFINLIPDPMKHAIYQIPYEWFEWEEAALVASTYGTVPHDTDVMYRINFWEAFYEKFEQEKRISMKDIVGETGTAYFNKSVLPNPGRLLYIITEPSKNKSQLRFTHHLALKTMIETLKMPILYNSKTGLPDTQLIAVKQKIYEYVDQRLHGSIIQRQQISSTSQSLNVNLTATQQMETLPKSIEEADARIKELELELASSPSLPPAVEVLPVEEVTQNVRAVLPSSMENK